MAVTENSGEPKTIEQINLAYEAVEDRLVLRLRSQDSALAELFLTRRLTRGFLPGLLHVAEKAVPVPDLETRRELLAYQHQRQVAVSEFERPFNADGRPLLEGGPILVTEVQMRFLAGSGGWRLEFIGRAGMRLSINLDSRSLHGVIKLFNDILPATGWDLPPARPEGATGAAGHVVH